VDCVLLLKGYVLWEDYERMYYGKSGKPRDWEGEVGYAEKWVRM
jgi:hypothetical protein